MTRIKKGGRELVVADTDAPEYIKQGYSVIDEKGNELTKPKAVTYTQAMRENVDLKAKVKALTAMLEAANTQISSLNQHITNMDVAVGEAPEKPAQADGNQPAAAKSTATIPHNTQTSSKRRSPSIHKPKNQAPQNAN